MDRIEKLKSFIARDSTDYFSRHALAMEYIKLGENEEAITLLEKIIEENPSYIGSYYHLGKLLELTGESEKAEVIYDRGIEEAGKLNDHHALSELMSAKDLMD